MTKIEINKMLENHLTKLISLANNEKLIVENPLLLVFITDSIKVTSLTMLFVDNLSK